MLLSLNIKRIISFCISVKNGARYQKGHKSNLFVKMIDSVTQIVNPESIAETMVIVVWPFGKTL